MTEIYGIKNCDTMKKECRWLEDNAVTYDFHDYKKESVDTNVLKQAVTEHGWELVINKRGTTWRQLDKSVQETMSDVSAIEIALDNPSIIKRPLLLHKDKTFLGFKAEDYKTIFNI